MLAYSVPVLPARPMLDTPVLVSEVLTRCTYRPSITSVPLHSKSPRFQPISISVKCAVPPALICSVRLKAPCVPVNFLPVTKVPDGTTHGRSHASFPGTDQFSVKVKLP